jgi:dimethylargininase
MVDTDSKWTALVRTPGLELERCALSFVRRRPIDVARARTQHQAYVAALERAGAAVTVLPRLPDHPDGTFVEDAAVVFDELAVIPRLGDDRRRGESASVRAALEPLRPILELRAPTTLDGGDVLVVGDSVYVGQSRRTNHAGLKAMAHALLEHGYLVKAVEVTGCLHLKTACTHLGDGRVLANPRWIQMGRMRGIERVDVHEDEPFAANVLRLGGKLLASKSFPRTNERLSRLGFEIEELEIDELEKAEAGITCLGILLCPEASHAPAAPTGDA